ncbi:hypothetical protein V5799_033237 [Amblyomma americanum]|uniref:Uncharacterized protein n=1 Tax=Amblyomma americanum TaxID=6943 RepID=A0AAQ4DNW7_AMBAM
MGAQVLTLRRWLGLQALMGRVTFFRSENSKLHLALEKERAKLRTLLDRAAGAPSSPPPEASAAAAALAVGGSSAASVPSAPSSAVIEQASRGHVLILSAPSTDTVPSTSTAPKLFSSNTTVASEVATTKDQLQEQEQSQAQLEPQVEPQHQPQPEQEPEQGSSTPPNPSDCKRIKLRTPTPQEEYKPPEISDVYEPKYSMSSSSLD